MMNDIDYTLIERYLSQDMSPEEQLQIERRALIDPDFGRELSAYQMAKEAIKLAQREELKNRFRQRDKILDKQNKDIYPGKSRSLGFLAIAATIAVLLAWQFLFKSPATSDQAISVHQDSTGLADTPLITDTIGEKKYIKDEIKNPENPVKVEKRKISKEETDGLMAANFEPYRDDSMEPASRGDENDATHLQNFMTHYWEENYKQVIVDFNHLEATHQQNDNLRFLYANALLSLNRLNDAATIMKGVMQNKKSIYNEEATYYMALININNQNLEEAKANLHAYLQYPDVMQKAKAEKILNKLK